MSYTNNDNMNTRSKTMNSNNSNNLTQIMNNISNNVNPKTASEGLALLSKPDDLIARLQSGSDQFQAQTGRPMTYSEMRAMFG
jgi:hypothetical protein